MVPLLTRSEGLRLKKQTNKQKNIQIKDQTKTSVNADLHFHNAQSWFLSCNSLNINFVLVKLLYPSKMLLTLSFLCVVLNVYCLKHRFMLQHGKTDQTNINWNTKVGLKIQNRVQSRVCMRHSSKIVEPQI